MSEARQDQGYALLATLWLLLLAASVTGLLMMRSVQGAKTVAAARADLLRSAGEDSALETAAADLLINGTASRFGFLPSTATYSISGNDYMIEASREADRIDINEAPLALVESELRLANIAPSVRAEMLAMLTSARQNRRTLVRNEDLDAITRTQPCAVDLFTPFQGRTAASTGERGISADTGIGRPTAWRLRIAGPGLQPAMIARAGLPGDQPLQVLEMPLLPKC